MRRPILRKSSSTGTGLADYAPAKTSRFQQYRRGATSNRRSRPKPRFDTTINNNHYDDDDDSAPSSSSNPRNNTMTAAALGYESMDDIGVRGVIPKAYAVRDDNDADDLVFTKSNDSSQDSADGTRTTTATRSTARGGARRRVRMYYAGV